jgi:hypothetical protein
VRWAKSLLTDCLYRLGCCYLDLGKQKAAAWCFREHLLHRTLGARSIYSIKDVREQLAKCAEPEFGDGELEALEKVETTA